MPTSQMQDRGERTSLRTHFFALGYTDMLDTYLSPEKYRGMDVHYAYEWERNMKRQNWAEYLMVSAQLQGGHNRADNANTVAGMGSIQNGMLYTWHLLDNRLTLRAGGGVQFDLGFIYNMRNQNNPAQLKAALNIMPRVQVAYNLKSEGKPLILAYDAMTPLLGIRFSPRYGQSYYEMFVEDNYDRNIVVTTPFNTPSLRHQLSIAFTLNKAQLLLGYLGDYQQADINDLKSHTWSHLFVIGFRKRLSIKSLQP